jgi:hypothetical protein
VRYVVTYISIDPHVASFFEFRIPLYYTCVTSFRDFHMAPSRWSPQFLHDVPPHYVHALQMCMS